MTRLTPQEARPLTSGSLSLLAFFVRHCRYGSMVMTSNPIYTYAPFDLLSERLSSHHYYAIFSLLSLQKPDHKSIGLSSGCNYWKLLYELRPG